MEKAKSRWTAKEIATLIEVWAEVCDSPGASRMERGSRMNMAIFERYSKRCKHMGMRVRSLNALHTQRDRISRASKFVSAFDLRQLAMGGRSWFHHSIQERERMDIPIELRRQASVFTQEMYDILRHVILPSERQTNGLKKQRLSKPKKHQTTAIRRAHQGCWTPSDEVLLVCRWGHFIKNEGLTLKEFLEKPFDNSFECMVTKSHSAFTCWRKICKLIVSYSFICAFNDHHQPGWFDLADNEQNLRIEWGNLPPDFEDIGLGVFRALEAAMPRLMSTARFVKEEPEMAAPPSPKSTSSCAPASLEVSVVPIAPLSTQDFKAEEQFSVPSTNVLDRLLLEDDDVDVVDTTVNQSTKLTTASEPFDDSSLYGACLLLNGKVSNRIDPPAMKEEHILHQVPHDCNPSSFNQSPAQALELMLESYKSGVQSDLNRLQKIIGQDVSCTQEHLRVASKRDVCGKVNSALSVQYATLVVKQHAQRLTSIVHFAEETCKQNSAEIRSLVEQFPCERGGSDNNPSVVMF